MLWNFVMHALMGWLGAYYFLLTTERIGVAILVVCKRSFCPVIHDTHDLI